MVVIIVLIISLITALAQIASSLSDLWKSSPTDPSKKKITKAGIFFYACTVLLVVLPAIQSAVQDNLDNKKDKKRLIEQDERDNRLRASYDSSLGEMKKKFDTTTSIVSETLGKYGYKLDSSNKLLVSLNDSSRIKIVEGDDPVIAIATDGFKGIAFNGIQPNGKYKFTIEVQSKDAGSSFYNIQLSFVIKRSDKLFYIPLDNPIMLQPPLWKNAIGELSVEFYNIQNYQELYLWLRGSYKRLNGTGKFDVDAVYVYTDSSKQVGQKVGQQRQDVINLIKANER